WTTSRKTAMNRDQLQSIAAALEDGYGDCPHGRAALLRWIEEEISRLKALGVPGGEAATMELGLSYLAWLGEE
ncbi:hypothetical protein ALP70_03351, partial [Pseudomonas savastanoi]